MNFLLRSLEVLVKYTIFKEEQTLFLALNNQNQSLKHLKKGKDIRLFY
jgi:hypothetical protein